MLKYQAIHYRDGRKHFYANRRVLNALMPGYKDESFLLHEVEVDTDSYRKIVEIKAQFRYDPAQSGYFEGHMDGLLQGQGGHGEFMAQAAAGGSVLVGGVGSKIVLLGTDTLRVCYPVKGEKDLTCIARPVASSECDNAFQCAVYSTKEYNRIGEKARMLSRVIILGQSVS